MKKIKYKFPLHTQYDSRDCGPTCLRMITSFYGKNLSLSYIRNLCSITNRGVSFLGLHTAAKQLGFESLCVRISLHKLISDVPLPCIIHWNNEHFVVLYKIKKKKKQFIFYIADPIGNKFKYSEAEFTSCWLNHLDSTGVALCIQPTEQFYKLKNIKTKLSVQWIKKYIHPYIKQTFQLIIGLCVSSILLLIFPIFTQIIVDYGIANQDIGFIWIILIAQLILVVGSTTLEFIKSWLLLIIGLRINITLISDYIIKLTKLPIKFFDTKILGDVLQRVNDHSRIRELVTETGLNTIFSIFNIIILSLVILYYNWQAFLIFITGSFLYLIWAIVFFNKRANLDRKMFAQSASNQNTLIQLVLGMQEIKLNGCETSKRWEWEKIQTKIYNIGTKGLALSQYQESGAILISQIKNFIITALVASLTIKGNMTLGMMMSIQFIVGMLNNPIDQLFSFIQKLQDAKLSLERINDIYAVHDEININHELVCTIPKTSITVENLSFKYDKLANEFILNNISFSIPKGKTTAIVGASGSGKTTILKLILGFYNPDSGNILIGNNSLNKYNIREWRMNCGVVMQDGYIFSDTIARNIILNNEKQNTALFQTAIKIAMLEDFIDSLPQGVNTMIGAGGQVLSAGQKQRLLLARAIYKNPKYVFLDEATNSLDTVNEMNIMHNIQDFLYNRTTIIIAHRLSTIQNAHNIVVLKNGCIAETGSHNQLIKNRKVYYNLVKNQLNI